MAKSSERIAWVDTLKFFCIYFVMISHLGRNELITYLGCFFNPFYLTGFLFASGYTFHYQPDFGVHLCKKIRQLLVPWFAFSMLCIILSSILTLNSQDHVSLSKEIVRNFLQIRGYGDEMWFASALFVVYIPLYFMIRNYENRKTLNSRIHLKFLLFCVILYFVHGFYMELMPKELLPGGCNGLPWHIEYIFFALFFLYSGYLFHEKYERLFDLYNTCINRILVMTAYISYVYIPVFMDISFPWYLRTLDVFIKNILGLSMIISLSKAFKSNRLTAFVGQNTMIYFGLHGKLIALWEAMFRYFLPELFTIIYTSEILSIPYSLMMGIILSISLVPAAAIIRNFFPFMLGRWYTENRC